MNHAVRACHQHENGYLKPRDVLLEFEVAVHGKQHLETTSGTAQKLTVLDPLPA